MGEIIIIVRYDTCESIYVFGCTHCGICEELERIPPPTNKHKLCCLHHPKNHLKHPSMWHANYCLLYGDKTIKYKVKRPKKKKLN